MAVLVRATSDTHGFWHDEDPASLIEPCDILIHAGDIMPADEHGSGNQRRFLVKRWYEWIEEVPADYVVWVAGNHDFLLEKNWVRHYLDKQPKKSRYLRDFSTTVCGLKIHGMPWAYSPEGWAFQALHETAMERRCSNIADDTDIIVSHGPPAHFGDRTNDGKLLGSFALEQRIKQVRPRLVVCGHIHEGHGTWEWPNVIVPRAETEVELARLEKLMAADGFWRSEDDAANVAFKHAEQMRLLEITKRPVVIANAARLNVDYEPTNPVQSFELYDDRTIWPV